MSFSPRRLRPRRGQSTDHETNGQPSLRLANRNVRGWTNPSNVAIEVEEENQEVNQEIGYEEVGDTPVDNYEIGIEADIDNDSNDTTVEAEVSVIDLTGEPSESPNRINRQHSLPPVDIPSLRLRALAPGIRRNLARSPAMVFHDVREMLQNFRRDHQVPSVMNMTVDLTDSADESKESIDESLSEKEGMDDNSRLDENLVIKCPVCLRSLQTLKLRGCSIMSTICGHIFCGKCLPQSLKSNGRCPSCRKVLGLSGYHKVFL